MENTNTLHSRAKVAFGFYQNREVDTLYFSPNDVPFSTLKDAEKYCKKKDLDPKGIKEVSREEAFGEIVVEDMTCDFGPGINGIVEGSENETSEGDSEEEGQDDADFDTEQFDGQSASLLNLENAANVPAQESNEASANNEVAAPAAAVVKSASKKSTSTSTKVKGDNK